MADEDDNLVVRLLREMRSELQELRNGQNDGNRRLTKIDRHLEEMKETMAVTAGMAMHANVIAETTGERFDELTDAIEALRRRVADLEMQR